MTLLDQNIQLREFVPAAPTINITPAAAERLASMMQERDLTDYALRVFVSGGGCSGMQYGMTFDNEPREGDTTWTAHGLNVMLDPISARYLSGARLHGHGAGEDSVRTAPDPPGRRCRLAAGGGGENGRSAGSRNTDPCRDCG